MEKKVKRKREMNHTELKPAVSVQIRGGRLWPLIDFQEILNNLMFGEDIFFINFYRNDRL